MKRLLISTTLALFTLGSAVHAQDRYTCTVADFIGFDKTDTAFVAKNMRKTFTLNIGKNSTQVSMHSTDFTPGDYTYNLVTKGFLDTLLAREDRNGKDTLVLPNRTKARIEKDGFFNATIAVQASFYNNAWLLRCVE